MPSNPIMNTTPRWEYSHGEISGFFESDGVHFKNQSHDSVSGAPIGSLMLPYRLLSRNGWHGEARELSHTMTVLQDGIECRWAPSIAHPAELIFQARTVGEGIFDLTFRIAALQKLVDYELFVSQYFDGSFQGGTYVQSLPGESGPVEGWTQVFPDSNPIYREMYIAFPRDERGAGMICDGRWQRGRHFTRFVPCRYYADPFGFYYDANSGLSVSLMGERENCYAVSMAYHAEDPNDHVGQHNSLYVSLFGRDIQPGETAVARLRLTVERCGKDAQRHFSQFTDFQNMLRTHRSLHPNPH